MYESQQKAIQDEKDNSYRNSRAAAEDKYRAEQLALDKANA
jgi:hypothetical protein